jgi:hypothetical protein
MSKDFESGSDKIRLGPREKKAALRLVATLGVGGLELGVRTAVTIAAALDNARRVGFAIRLIGSDGRQYAYDLSDPKLAHELDKRGVRTGKSVNLIENLAPSPAPTPKPRLRRIK